MVKLYCSIHEPLNATMPVAATRWFAVVNAKGAYALTGIPRYRGGEAGFDVTRLLGLGENPA